MFRALDLDRRCHVTSFDDRCGGFRVGFLFFLFRFANGSLLVFLIVEQTTANSNWMKLAGLHPLENRVFRDPAHHGRDLFEVHKRPRRSLCGVPSGSFGPNRLAGWGEKHREFNAPPAVQVRASVVRHADCRL